MLVYRVFPWAPDADPEQPGGALYAHRPQAGGRIDHPDYHVWYLGSRPEVAVGEALGNLTRWDPSVFQVPFLTRGTRALATMRLPDDLRILDLDDPRVLLDRALRPTQVVARNRAVTQAWGHRAWSERDPHGEPHRWQAVQWWSVHEPAWSVLASWVRPSLEDVTPLTGDHPAVREAARVLRRPLELR